MKTLFTISLVFLSLFAVADSWTRKADFAGVTRLASVSFCINSKGYIGTGFDSLYSTNYRKDFWEYDPLINTWTQKADFAGTARIYATGFSIGTKGYIGTGNDNSGNNNDLWEWDQASNMWTQKTNFGTIQRNASIGFSIGTKGYIGSGYSTQGFLNDFWEWDQVSDTWTQKTNLGGNPRCYAIGFSIGNKGYISTGELSVTTYNDLWEWDQASNTWSQKSNFAGTARYGAIGFSIGTKGFIGTGIDNTAPYYKNDFWEWDQASNTWSMKANFVGAARRYATGFNIGTKGYVGIGNASPSYFNDFYEYTPDSTTGISDLQLSSFQFQFTPNPAKDFIVCSFGSLADKKIVLNIFDVMGKAPLPPKGGFKNPLNGKIVIDVRDFAPGVYFIEATDEKEKMVQKFVKQ